MINMSYTVNVVEEQSNVVIFNLEVSKYHDIWNIMGDDKRIKLDYSFVSPGPRFQLLCSLSLDQDIGSGLYYDLLRIYSTKYSI